MTTAATFDAYLTATRDKPVYVVLGVQGSGTNLLSRMLVRIFGFSVLHDRSLVFNAAARLGPNPPAHAVISEIRNFRSLIAPTGIRRRIKPRSVKRPELFEGVFDRLRPDLVHSGADFARLIYSYRAHSLGASEMAIKSDDIWEHLEAIDTVLPNRRIILLTRDFRDNLLSVAGKPFGPIEPIRAAQYVKRRFLPYEAEYRRAGTLGYHVTFETLVERPEEFVRDFSRHFGLAPQSDPERVLERMPPRPNKIAKWKALPDDDLAWCEAILRDQLVAFGYQPSCPESPPRTRAALMAVTLSDMVKRVPQKLRTMFNRLS